MLPHLLSPDCWCHPHHHEANIWIHRHLTITADVQPRACGLLIDGAPA